MFCSKCGATVPEAAAACPACGQPTGGVAAPAYAAAVPRVVYAGFWLRFVAWILDRILIGVVTQNRPVPILRLVRFAHDLARTSKSGRLGAIDRDRSDA